MFYSRSDYPVRIKIVAIIISHLAIIASGYCFFLRSELMQRQYLRQSLHEKQSRLLLIKDQHANKIYRQNTLALLKKPVNNNFLMTTITHLCQQHHLNLIRIEPKNRQLTQEANQFDLLMQGDFLNIMAFLKNLLQLHYLLIIPQLQMQKKNGALTLQCIIEVVHD